MTCLHVFFIIIIIILVIFWFFLTTITHHVDPSGGGSTTEPSPFRRIPAKYLARDHDGFYLNPSSGAVVLLGAAQSELLIVATQILHTGLCIRIFEKYSVQKAVLHTTVHSQQESRDIFHNPLNDSS